MSIVHIAFYPSDWLAGTRGLSDAETGVYITLIARMYEMAGPIERDDNRLSRLCGSKSKSSFVKSLEYLVSEGKILESDGNLFNERVEKEIKKTTEKSSKARDAAQSRWDRKSNKNNRGVNADASPKHMPQPCQSEPEPELEKRETKVSPKKRSSRIKEDAQITAGMVSAAVKRKLSGREAEAQFQKFKNSAIAKGRVYENWDRAFITWLDSEYFKLIHPSASSGVQAGAFGSIKERC